MITDVELLGESYYYLGLVYKHRQGIFQDEEKAGDFFKLAVSHGCKRAKYEL
jgi:TPR repeat protein